MKMCQNKLLKPRILRDYFPVSGISKKARYQTHIIGFAVLPELDILWQNLGPHLRLEDGGYLQLELNGA
jgi:hypothetical protein